MLGPLPSFPVWVTGRAEVAFTKTRMSQSAEGHWDMTSLKGFWNIQMEIPGLETHMEANTELTV